MDKLLRGIEAFCKLTSAEREKRYRESCRMAKIGELLQVENEEISEEVSGKLDKLLSISFDDWKKQQLTDEELARIRVRDDQVGCLSGKHQDHMIFVFDEGDIPADSILFHDREDECPYYGKTCEETLQDMADELQDMIGFLEYMDMVEDKDMSDMLNILEANLLAYNEGI